jgi:hypothetical protein
MLVISSLPQRLGYNAVDLPLEFSELHVEHGGRLREGTGQSYQPLALGLRCGVSRRRSLAYRPAADVLAHEPTAIAPGTGVVAPAIGAEFPTHVV